jgi:hypothetical protein
MIVDARMQARAIIESHICTQLRFEMLKVLEQSTSYPFSLHGMEEGFHVRIILTVIRPVHTDTEAMTIENIGIISSSVFYSPV